MKRILLFLSICLHLHATDQSNKIVIDYHDWYQEAPECRKGNFNAQYVLSKYEKIVEGRNCVYYPAKNPKRMVISFSYAVFGAYAMWSWFWKDTEDWDDTAYLFLRDDMITWYVGTKTAPSILMFKSIIDHFLSLSGLTYDKCFSMGSSAGGYGALLYAIALGFKGAMVEVPTFDKDLWNYAVGWEQIRPDFQWVDLSILLKHVTKFPHISVQYGNWPGDMLCCGKMVDVLRETKCPFTVWRTSMPNHYTAMNKAFIEKEIAHIERQVDLDTMVPAQYRKN